MGKYQYLVLLLMTIINFISAIPLTGFGLFFYTPDYICINNDGSEFLCSKKEACSGSQNFRLDETVQSLNYVYNLSCEKENIAIKFSFIVFTSASLLLPLVSLIDRFIGKKGMILLSMFLAVVAYVIELLANSFYVSCFSVFVLVLCKIIFIQFNLIKSKYYFLLLCVYLLFRDIFRIPQRIKLCYSKYWIWFRGYIHIFNCYQI